MRLRVACRRVAARADVACSASIPPPASPAAAEHAQYDLLLRGGHVIDPRNGISAVRDVAIAGGKVAAVAATDRSRRGRSDGRRLGPLRHARADRHPRPRLRRHRRDELLRRRQQRLPRRVHAPRRRHDRRRRRLPGWRNFEDFKQRVIDRSRTRVLAFLNIVGNGMRGGEFEQDLADMEAQADRRDGARATRALIVGIKTAHYAGPEWAPVERAVEAGTRGGHPGDGRLRHEPARAAARRARHEEAAAGRHLHPRLLGAARRAGSLRAREPGAVGRHGSAACIFDVGHGGGSFAVADRGAGRARKDSCPTRSRPTCTSAA